MGFTMNLLAIPPILFALCFHEFSHAYIAFRLGDATAAHQGRLTLNPLRHLDPIGTLLLFFVGFGWARPVPVNPVHLRNPRKDMLWIAAAGPLSNILLALLSGLALNLLRPWFDSGSPIVVQSATMLIYSVQINLVLAFFNLIPLAPLDGATVLKGILPLEKAYAFSRIEAAGPMVLMILVGSSFLFGFSLLHSILGPPVAVFSTIFTLGLMG